MAKADGTAYPLLATCIDSGGHHTDAVYRFAKERLNRRVFAIKGMGGSGVPFIRNPSKNNRVKADLFILGVDAGKTTIYQRLEVKTPDRTTAISRPTRKRVTRRNTSRA